MSRFSRLKHELFAYIHRNEIILNNLSHKATPNQVNLHWYKYPGTVGDNLGDYLSTVVHQYMLESKNIVPDAKTSKTKHLLGIGSVLSQGYQDATVWSSGLILEKSFKLNILFKIRKLDIRAVRGPLTRKVLVQAGYKCPEIYGDGAILMPFIYQPECTTKKYNISLVAHRDFPIDLDESFNIHKINIKTIDYKSFIDEIVASKLIISTSLHGIILAETYGVPAIWVKNDRVGVFKFYDWYAATNRSHVQPVSSVEDALNTTPPEPIANLQELQEGLIKSFPYDLWDK